MEITIARYLRFHFIFTVTERVYDTVPLTRLFEVLRRSRMEPPYTQSIFNNYKRAECVVTIGREVSENIRASNNLGQSRCLSTIEFKVYIQEALNEWRTCSRMAIEI